MSTLHFWGRKVKFRVMEKLSDLLNWNCLELWTKRLHDFFTKLQILSLNIFKHSSELCREYSNIPKLSHTFTLSYHTFTHSIQIFIHSKEFYIVGGVKECALAKK